jgi:hypothetical protein
MVRPRQAAADRVENGPAVDHLVVGIDAQLNHLKGHLILPAKRPLEKKDDPYGRIYGASRLQLLQE